ncbi:MAG: biliverdin-producing heme oxygenase [Chitinophagaceae bacterium]
MFINQLREATKASHQQLDHQLYPIIQSVSSEQAYGHLLTVFYGFYQPIYQRLNAFLSDGTLVSDYQQRRQPYWILDDLKTLDISASSGENCQHLPAIDTLSAALGAYYVMEGATMGGSIIAKKIASNTGLEESGNALRFFSAYRENNGKMWKIFLDTLENVAAQDEDVQQEIINTAQQTFERFGQWIKAQY